MPCAEDTTTAMSAQDDDSTREVKMTRVWVDASPAARWLYVHPSLIILPGAAVTFLAEDGTVHAVIVKEVREDYLSEDELDVAAYPHVTSVLADPEETVRKSLATDRGTIQPLVQSMFTLRLDDDDDGLIEESPVTIVSCHTTYHLEDPVTTVYFTHPARVQRVDDELLDELSRTLAGRRVRMQQIDVPAPREYTYPSALTWLDGGLVDYVPVEDGAGSQAATATTSVTTAVSLAAIPAGTSPYPHAVPPPVCGPIGDDGDDGCFSATPTRRSSSSSSSNDNHADHAHEVAVMSAVVAVTPPGSHDSDDDAEPCTPVGKSSDPRCVAPAAHTAAATPDPTLPGLPSDEHESSQRSSSTTTAERSRDSSTTSCVGSADERQTSSAVHFCPETDFDASRRSTDPRVLGAFRRLAKEAKQRERAAKKEHKKERSAKMKQKKKESKGRVKEQNTTTDNDDNVSDTDSDSDTDIDYRTVFPTATRRSDQGNDRSPHEDAAADIGESTFVADDANDDMDASPATAAAVAATACDSGNMTVRQSRDQGSRLDTNGDAIRRGRVVASAPGASGAGSRRESQDTSSLQRRPREDDSVSPERGRGTRHRAGDDSRFVARDGMDTLAWVDDGPDGVILCVPAGIALRVAPGVVVAFVSRSAGLRFGSVLATDRVPSGSAASFPFALRLADRVEQESYWREAGRSSRDRHHRDTEMVVVVKHVVGDFRLETLIVPPHVRREDVVPGAGVIYGMRGKWHGAFVLAVKYVPRGEARNLQCLRNLMYDRECEKLKRLQDQDLDLLETVRRSLREESLTVVSCHSDLFDTQSLTVCYSADTRVKFKRLVVDKLVPRLRTCGITHFHMHQLNYYDVGGR